MPFQEDSLIFPFQPQPPPDVPAGESVEDFQKWASSMQDWAFNMTRGLKDHQQQVVDKYNMHLKNEFAHPQGWATFKIMKPRYEQGDGNTVRIPASTTTPVYFSVGSKSTSTTPAGFKILEATSNVDMDITVTGVGGLVSGATRAVDTVYYLYVVDNGGSPAAIADSQDPDTGLRNYTDWTYIGAFITNSTGSGEIPPFRSDQGFFHSEFQFATTAGVNSTSPTAAVLSPFPSTAYAVWGKSDSKGTNTAAPVTHVSGKIASPYFSHESEVDSSSGTYIKRSFGWVPIFTSKTIYLWVDNSSNDVQWYPHGWREDPTRWK